MKPTRVENLVAGVYTEVCRSEGEKQALGKGVMITLEVYNAALLIVLVWLCKW